MWTELNAQREAVAPRESPLLCALLHLVVLDCMQHDFVGVSRGITGMSF
jgi:hypothetical protein